MADPKNTHGGQDLPSTPAVTFINPRRATAENSITLRHHRLARDASKRHTPSAIPDAHSKSAGARVKIPRRNSSEESHETGLSGSNRTGLSDPKQWFDQQNQHATWTLDSGDMDIDPPFFQKETDSSNEEIHHIGPSRSGASYRHPPSRGASYRPSFAKSSSAEEYRSVIDDLTIENRRLKEELRRFKQMGPSSLRNEKLFEVKVHGLPSRKKRELEATLRDFTSNLEHSAASASTNRKKASGQSKEGASSVSKHPSSTSGSGSRPVDSAYASMSTGQSSSFNARPDQGRAARLRSNQNVEDYLRDIPEGLWPRPVRLTEADKKKLVVKRLEQLFTGKMFYSASHLKSANVRQPAGNEIEMADGVPKIPLIKEGAREAVIRDKMRRQRAHHPHTAANASTIQNPQTHSYSNSHSNADQSNYHDYDKDSGTGSGSGSRSAQDGKNSSPQDEPQASEQRPTRLGDLDPDRQQVPADNMEYIRHLGLVAPESRPHFSARDVSPDGEGWVYLNLLGNLAQLHILNVTPDFIRTAVSEKSTKFQLSPDGRKIRWRGGDEGTRFTSDSCTRSETEGSGDEESNGDEQPNKRRKQKGSKFGLGAQKSSASEKFHYKPLFARRQSTFPDEDTIDGDYSISSNLQSEQSNPGAHSRWDQSGVSTGLSQRKRRRDGAIIYYSGAPFCTDLSGDSGELSPDTYNLSPSSGDQPMTDSPIYPHLTHRPHLSRSASGSSIPSKPLSDPNPYASLTDPTSSGEVDHIVDEDDDDIEADFAWSDSDQQSFLTNLEASGLGGVYPSDHFVVVVSTKRPKTAKVEGGIADDDKDESSMTDEDRSQTSPRKNSGSHGYNITNSQGLVDSIIKNLALISTESPAPKCGPPCRASTVEIRYVDGKVHRLPPVPLPPPTFFVPSGESNSDAYDDSYEDAVSVSSERSILSKRPMLECTPDSDHRDLSGNDEEDEHSDGSPNFVPNANTSDMSGMPGIGQEDKFPVSHLLKDAAGSSAATAGGAGSICYSSLEEA